MTTKPPKHYTHFSKSWKRLHHIVWHAATGHWIEWPEALHHIDGNPLNNELANLQLMLVFEHTSLHAIGKPRSYETRAKISTALIEQWENPEFRNNRIEAMNRLDVKTKQSIANMGKNNPMYGMTGEACPSWKGDIASDHAKYMREWRTKRMQEKF